MHTRLACSFKRSQPSVKGVNVLLWRQRIIIIIIILEMVARPQMSNGYGGMDPSWQTKWQRVLNRPCSSLQDAWPWGHKCTHTEYTCTFPLIHTHTHTIKSNGVCLVAVRGSPLMSGSHNNIIAVDVACWGILFHTIAMLHTSTCATHQWWWQKFVLTPDQLVDALTWNHNKWIPHWDKKTAVTFQTETEFICFFLLFLTKTHSRSSFHQSDGAVWAFNIQVRQLYRLLEILSDLKCSLLWI